VVDDGASNICQALPLVRSGSAPAPSSATTVGASSSLAAAASGVRCRLLGTGGHCSPGHRVTLDSRDECSK